MRRCDGGLADVVHVVPGFLVGAVELAVPDLRPDAVLRGGEGGVFVAAVEGRVGGDADGGVEDLVEGCVIEGWAGAEGEGGGEGEDGGRVWGALGLRGGELVDGGGVVAAAWEGNEDAAFVAVGD